MPTIDDQAAWRNLTGCFPDAPTAVSRPERAMLSEILPHLRELTDDDWHAVRAWNDAPDRVRGRKLWPRDRGEFLAHYFEAIQKIRPWWRKTGRRWWQERQGKPASRQPDTASTADHVPATPEEIAEIFRDDRPDRHRHAATR
ncbi:hypothetical protein [Haloferula sp. A504]|uniref:hypothetical protein n=1 Tax=Haloferula sp. A504 TaxID=3373601 RepID=UPI0031C5DFA5|nr:hypothetical protein [Verrucomicrobiaceae bacterium E54]